MMTNCEFIRPYFLDTAWHLSPDDGSRFLPPSPLGEKGPEGRMRGLRGKEQASFHLVSAHASLCDASPSSGLPATFSPLGRRETAEA
ncbi:hypothetical protein FHT91_002857 [Rhizobium sp. BK347]|nr:hypothetical protein [Rhizobium sp. BK252]MBB3402621.1 hypothetical protein [Rhizobium sp. BK289]MBB3415197.1 hypothetical protein [Rhizobium sp. BK284]MBB3483086.1 hypothetical protein [Rhizobium sp. BK347]